MENRTVFARSPLSAAWWFIRVVVFGYLLIFAFCLGIVGLVIWGLNTGFIEDEACHIHAVPQEYAYQCGKGYIAAPTRVPQNPVLPGSVRR